MNVTINTDASFHPDFKVGGFAFWIVCDQGRIKRSGRLQNPKNSTEAETMCIANAVHILLNSNITGITKIVINTDSKNSMTFIKKSAKVGSCYRVAALLLTKLKRKHGSHGRCTHEFRHVKAHSNKDDKRSWVNDWCDKQAKKEMRAFVSEIRIKDAEDQRKPLKQLKA